MGKVYVKYVLSSDLGITGSEEAVEEGKVFVKKMVALLLKGKVHSWTVLTGSVPVQTLPGHSMHLFGHVYKDAMLTA